MEHRSDILKKSYVLIELCRSTGIKVLSEIDNKEDIFYDKDDKIVFRIKANLKYIEDKELLDKLLDEAILNVENYKREINKKYYFITYQAKNTAYNSIESWNKVVDVSPMAYIREVIQSEARGIRMYTGYVVTNIHEITKEEFNEFNKQF